MARLAGALGALVLWTSVLVAVGPPAAAATPVPVLTTPAGEFQPAAGAGVIAWEENSKSAPNDFNVYVRRDNGAKTRVNARGTRGANGGIDGDLLVYQQYRGGQSDIKIFNFATNHRSNPPARVNTPNWEYWPSISGKWLLFGRLKDNGHRRLLLYNRAALSLQVLARSSNKSDLIEPGQVNGDHVVWSTCARRECNVFHHDIQTGDTEQIPNPGRSQHAPSVSSDGIVYFVRSGDRCGGATTLMRRTPEGVTERLTRLPDGNSIADTYAHTSDAGLTEVYYENNACGSAHRSDIFKVEDGENLDPELLVVKAGSGSGTVTSAPAGIDCGSTCSAVFARDEIVQLTATAATGSDFAGWNGAGCSGTDVCSVQMDAARTVTATFEKLAGPPTLTVSKAGQGTGTVTSSPAGINCGSDCSETYALGTVVTLTATGTGGSDFAGWSGGCSGAGTCTVTMDQAVQVTATFTGKFTLVVFKSGTGAGSVSSSPAGISCGSQCSAAYPPGTVVTLTAFAFSDSAFTGWSGACSGSATSCSVTVTETKSVTATFTSHLLTVTKAGNGTGTVTSSPSGIDCGSSCSKSFAPGSVVQLTAAPGPNSTFAGWSGACTGTGSCSVTMDAAKTVTATFDGVQRDLTVNVVTQTATGTVTSSPAGINCPGDCSQSYADGTVVQLTATPGASSSFTGWSGDCTGTGSCTVTMDGTKSVTATFGPVARELTVSVPTSSGTGTVTGAGISCPGDCSESYPHGTMVELTAAPTSGSTFEWSGDCTGTSNPCTVTMDAARSVTATFTAGPSPMAQSIRRWELHMPMWWITWLPGI